jgi:phosphoglycerate kinase
VGVRSLDDWIPTSGSRRPLAGRRVLVRSDLNVPLEAGRISDDSRLRASLGTIQRLRDAGARVIVCSHLGRPKGTRVDALSLRPVADALAGLLGCPVAFATDCVGEAATQAVASLGDGEVLLLENLRFHRGETDNDADFARGLAELADLYVNDAFGTAHRAHASTVGIVAWVEDAVAGDLLLDEIQQLGVVLDPERPLLCLLGGAKVSDKLGVLEALAQRADVLAIGGAMAYTFLAARGVPIGLSRVEPDLFEAARAVERSAVQSGCRVLLPVDHVVAKAVDANAHASVVERIPDDQMALDIGPRTADLYAAEAASARTLLWNGPMGVFEIAAFAHGTERVARAVAESSAHSVVGGGDSLAAIERVGVADRIDHLSTGGGASLEFVEGLELPGIAALER